MAEDARAQPTTGNAVDKAKPTALGNLCASNLRELEPDATASPPKPSLQPANQQVQDLAEMVADTRIMVGPPHQAPHDTSRCQRVSDKTVTDMTSAGIDAIVRNMSPLQLTLVLDANGEVTEIWFLDPMNRGGSSFDGITRLIRPKPAATVWTAQAWGCFPGQSWIKVPLGGGEFLPDSSASRDAWKRPAKWGIPPSEAPAAKGAAPPAPKRPAAVGAKEAIVASRSPRPTMRDAVATALSRCQWPPGITAHPLKWGDAPPAEDGPVELAVEVRALQPSVPLHSELRGNYQAADGLVTIECDQLQTIMNAQRLYKQGHTALQREQAGQAARLFDQCLGLLPTHSECWWELGWSHWSQENWSGAVKAWERTHALNPTREHLAEMLPKARAKVR